MNRIIVKTSQIVSDIFSPLLLPTYCMAMAMPLQALPERNRMIATLGVLVITGLIPYIFIKVMMRLGRISDAGIADRSERLVPMIVGIICYVVSALYVWYLGGPQWLSLFFVGAAAAAVVSLIITRFWKISAHMIGIGGLLGGLMGVSQIHLVNPYPAFMAVLLIAGLLGTSRIFLKRHTPLQVYAGFSLGFMCTFVASMMSYIYLFI